LIFLDTIIKRRAHSFAQWLSPQEHELAPPGSKHQYASLAIDLVRNEVRDGTIRFRLDALGSSPLD
jgi:hypothetical protein